MLFRDYVTILKKHYKRTISVQKLCELLFDFVLDNATVENDESVPVAIGKDRISRMMNGKAAIHQFIRDHICDDSVTESLVSSFQKKVLPDLVDDTDDLIFQLMQKISHDNISPSHKAMFKRIAKKKTLAVFLSDTFQYAITNNSDEHFDEDKTITSPKIQAAFKIRGISNNNTVEVPLIKQLEEKIGYSKDDLLDNINHLYKEALSLPVNHYEPEPSGMLSLFRGQSYKFEYFKEKLISEFSEMLKIDLPEDFFDMGDLFVNPIPQIGRYGQFINNIDGSQEAKNRLKALNSIYDAILDASEKATFLSDFSELFYLELAIENTGNDFDEDVRVTLKFPHNSVLTPSDIMNFEKSTVNYFVYKMNSMMTIDRGMNHLSFYEDNAWIPPIDLQLPFNSSCNASFDDVQDVLRFFFVSNEEYDTVEVKFESINQHTTIAFPCPILLKNNDIKVIDYSIRTKKSPDIIHGKIKL